MIRITFVFFLVLSSFYSISQTPLTAPLPSKFDGMKQLLSVTHSPEKNYATLATDLTDRKYAWKHATSIKSPQSEITILEGGAYLFYNKQWNIRTSYKAKEFSKLFNCPNEKMAKSKTYTFEKNWRTGNDCFGGWAMWYVIGVTNAGEKVFGVGKLETVGAMTGAESFYKLDKANSLLKWQGSAAVGTYAPKGILKVKKGEFVIKDSEISITSIAIDMESMTSENDDLTKHLKSKDFFRVDKFPEAIFELAEPVMLKEGEMTITGMLTIKKTSEKIAFPINLSRIGNKIYIKGTWIIDRTKFGITYNSPSYFEKMKDQAIADEFTISFDWVFEKQE